MFIPKRRSAIVSVLVPGVLTALAACGSSQSSSASAIGRHVAQRGPAVPSSAAGTATWSPWPSALHDARHSGSSPVAGPIAGHVRWQRTLEGGVTPGPVVGTDGTIYASSNAGILHALDPATGKDRWTYDSHAGQNGADLSVSPLVLPDGDILFPTPGNSLVALSPAGRELWRQTLPGQPTSPVSTDGKRVYVGDQAGSVTALDVARDGTHKVAWTVGVGTSSLASVVTNGSGAVYTTSGTALVAIADHGDSAAVAWRADPHDDMTEVSPGLAPDGTVLLGTNGTNEWAYGPDGGPRWHSSGAKTYASPAVTATGLAFVGDNDGRVHVYDTATGKETGDYRVTNSDIWSSTVVDKDYRLYYGGQNGHVYGVSAAGVVLFDVDLGAPVDSYPALTGDGTLVVGAANGTLADIG